MGKVERTSEVLPVPVAADTYRALAGQGISAIASGHYIVYNRYTVRAHFI